MMDGRAKIFLVAFLVAVAVVGCRVEWLSDEEIIKDLVVISTSPADRQTNVTPNAKIVIRTSEPLDPEFVVPNQTEPWKNSQVILVDQANAVIPVAYAFNGEFLTLTPITPFGPQSTYGVAVRPGVRDIYGKNISTPYAFTFSTGSTLTAIPNWPPFTIVTTTTTPPVPGTFTLTGQLNIAGCMHEAVLLNSGKVMICGGCPVPGAAPFRRAEIFDPVTQTWALCQSNQAQGMFFVRYRHTAVKLLNGRILVIGGFDNTSTWDSVEEYDPLQDSFSLLINVLQAPRYWHSAVLLSNGNPMVIGGAGPGGIHDTMEILDLATGAWVQVQQKMGGTVVQMLWSGTLVGRYGHESVVLPGGCILTCGGYTSGGTDDTSELYWPSTGVGAMGTPLFTGSYMSVGADQHTATLLTTGYGQGIVIVIGGERDDYTFSPITINTAQVYDHSLTVQNPVLNGNQGVWSPVGMSMSEKRCMHTATLLVNGKILVAGGFNVVGNSPSRTAELMDPFGLGNNVMAPWSGIDLTSKFDWTRDPQGNQTILSNLMTGVACHSATTLRDGRVLVAGGVDFLPFPPMLVPNPLCWLYAP